MKAAAIPARSSVTTSRWRRTPSGIRRQTAPLAAGVCTVLGEKQIVVHSDFSVERPVRQSLQAEGTDRIDDVSEPPERLDTFGQVLVQKNPHGAEIAVDRASSSRVPRTASSLSVGYARTISEIVMPAASDSRRNATEMRVPATRGLPARCSGSATIHFIEPSPRPWSRYGVSTSAPAAASSSQAFTVIASML